MAKLSEIRLKPKVLDKASRCCGRKPIAYKRPPHLFCVRCDAAFDLSGMQIDNWAYRREGNAFLPLMCEASLEILIDMGRAAFAEEQEEP